MGHSGLVRIMLLSIGIVLLPVIGACTTASRRPRQPLPTSSKLEPARPSPPKVGEDPADTGESSLASEFLANLEKQREQIKAGHDRLKQIRQREHDAAAQQPDQGHGSVRHTGRGADRAVAASNEAVEWIRTASVSEPKPAAEADPSSGDEAGEDTADRAQMLARLQRHIASSDDPAVRKALAAAALKAVDPSVPFDESLLHPLSHDQREAVRRYAQLLERMAREIEKRRTAPTPDEGRAIVDEVFGIQPLYIRRIALCRRVQGYGVYETMPAEILAGREHAMVVYAEIENFQIARRGDMHEVALTQQIELFTSEGDEPVWQQPIQRITDQSRNRRRDFFTVQLVRLPGTLGVGNYSLRVRVTDLNGKTFHAATVPIRIVADRSLVDKSAGRQKAP